MFEYKITIVTVGSEFREYADKVRNNKISSRYKYALCYEDDSEEKKKLAFKIPRSNT